MIIKKIIIISIGLLSIYAGCNKSVSITLDATKSFSVNGKIIKCHWWQVSGPSTVTFSNQDSIITTVTGNKPIEGLYKIGGQVTDQFGIQSDTIISYILPQRTK